MKDQPTFTAEQIRQAQQALGLSDSQFAYALGFSSPQSVLRLKVRNPEAKSFRPIQGGTARLLQAYIDGYRPGDWPNQ